MGMKNVYDHAHVRNTVRRMPTHQSVNMSHAPQQVVWKPRDWSSQRADMCACVTLHVSRRITTVGSIVAVLVGNEATHVRVNLVVDTDVYTDGDTQAVTTLVDHVTDLCHGLSLKVHVDIVVIDLVDWTAFGRYRRPKVSDDAPMHPCTPRLVQYARLAWSVVAEDTNTRQLCPGAFACYTLHNTHTRVPATGSASRTAPSI
jgi:hypothetical protein